MEAKDWYSLCEFELPMVAIMSANAHIRTEAKQLQKYYEHLLPYHPGAHWQAILIAVLDKEPV